MKSVANSVHLSVLGLLSLTLTVGCATSGGGHVANSFIHRKPAEKKSVAKKADKDVSPGLQLAWAQVQMRDQQYSEARKTFQAVLEKDPESVEATLGLARLDLIANRPAEAEKHFQQALKIAPDSPTVLDAVGQYYASVDRYPEAMDLFKKAIEIDPDQKAFRYHYGLALAKSGRVQESLPHFVQSVGPAGAHYNVGRILYDQGKLDASEEQFMQALIKDPQLREAQEWLDEVRQVRDGQLAQTRGTSSGGRGTRITPLSNSQQAGGRTQVISANQSSTYSAYPTGSAPSNRGAETGSVAAQRIPLPQTTMTPVANQPIPAMPRDSGNAPPRTNPMSSPANSPALNPVQQEQMRNQRLRQQAAAGGMGTAPSAPTGDGSFTRGFPSP